jgi:hypothetical protein
MKHYKQTAKDKKGNKKHAFLYLVFAAIFIAGWQSCDTATASNENMNNTATIYPNGVAVELLLDESKSAIEGNAIPAVTTEEVLLIIDHMAKMGGGVLRIEGVIENARVSIPLRLEIPALFHAQIPKEPINENNDPEFFKEEEEYKHALKEYSRKYAESIAEVNQYKGRVRDTIARYLTNYYQTKRTGSDINGALTNSQLFLDGSGTSLKVIIGSSDYIHDLTQCGKCDYHPTLPNFSSDTKIFQVTPNKVSNAMAIESTHKDALDTRSITQMIQ